MTSLGNLIRHVESNNEGNALRFEPHVYKRASDGEYALAQGRAMGVNHCSKATGAMIIATSWGAAQIMGFNLYGGKVDLKVTIGEYLASRPIQDEALDKFLRSIGYELGTDVSAWTPGQFASFARMYNGPGAPAAYVKRMEEVLASLGG